MHALDEQALCSDHIHQNSRSTIEHIVFDTRLMKVGCVTLLCGWGMSSSWHQCRLWHTYQYVRC